MPTRHGSLGSIACGADQGRELGYCVSVVDASHGSIGRGALEGTWQCKLGEVAVLRAYMHACQVWYCCDVAEGVT